MKFHHFLSVTTVAEPAGESFSYSSECCWIFFFPSCLQLNLCSKFLSCELLTFRASFQNKSPENSLTEGKRLQRSKIQTCRQAC